MSLAILFIFATPDTLVLSFEDALARAYQNAPDVRIAGVTIDEKELEQKKVLSQFFPEITGSSQVMRLSEAPSFSFEPVPGYPIDVTLGDEHVEIIQAGVELPLWTFGRRLEGYALAGEAVQLARLDSLEVLRTIRLNVTELYANIIALSDAERLSQEALENASRHRETIEDKYDQGLVSRYSLLEAQTKEAGLRPELINLRDQQITLLTRLGILLNLGPDTVLVLTSDRQLPDTTMNAYTLDDVLKRRPAWLEIELGKSMVDRQIKLKQREALPSIAAGANYTVQRSPLTSGEWETGWSYSLRSQVPICVGFTHYTEVKRLEKEKEKLAIQEEALRCQVRYELAEAEGGYRTALARLDAARCTENQAAELVSIVEKRYREGLTSDVDLLDSKLGLNKARTDRVMAERDVIITHERWLKAIGGEQ